MLRHARLEQTFHDQIVRVLTTFPLDTEGPRVMEITIIGTGHTARGSAPAAGTIAVSLAEVGSCA
jgi:hypothetical protein